MMRDKDLLDSEVTGAEIEKVITLLKKETSPGEDGIISEFYQEYWYLIHNELTDVIKDSFNTKTISMSQYSGIMSLLYKSGEREDIKNWRPITLLNTDYKICSKLLAERLKNVYLKSQARSKTALYKVDIYLTLIDDYKI